MKPVHANRHTRIMQTWLYCKNDRISISPHAAGQAAVLPHDHATHGHSCMTASLFRLAVMHAVMHA